MRCVLFRDRAFYNSSSYFHISSTTHRWARYVRYNGGVGKEQLSWLEGELQEASLSGQRVIGFGHVPIHPGDTLDHVLLWNYEDVRSRTVLLRHI